MRLVTPDPFPSPAHKKEGKGSGPPDYKKIGSYECGKGRLF